MCQSCGPLDNSSPIFNRHTLGNDLQEEGSHDGCFKLGLGRSVRGQSGIRLLVNPRMTPTHQLPRNDGCLSGPRDLPTSLTGALRPSPFGQHNCSSLYQLPRQPQVTFPLPDDLSSPALGAEQTPLNTSGSCAGQTEPGSGHAVQRQCSSR